MEDYEKIEELESRIAELEELNSKQADEITVLRKLSEDSQSDISSGLAFLKDALKRLDQYL